MSATAIAVTRADIWLVDAGPRGDWVILEVADGAGHVGLADASQSGADQVVIKLLKERLLPHLLGRPAADAQFIIEQEWEVAAEDRSLATAVSALELSTRHLSDCAQSHALHSESSEGDHLVPLYANINRGLHDRSPIAFARRAEQAVRDGFAAVKCFPLDEASHGKDNRIALELAYSRVMAIRSAVGPDVLLMVDCQGRLNRLDAIKFADRLARLDVGWFEEPVWSHEDLETLAEIRHAISLPLACGEFLFGAARYRELVRVVRPSFIMPDIKHCGGFDEMVRIASEAAAAGVQVSPHNPSGPVATLFSGLAVSMMAQGFRLEYPWGEVPWRAILLDPPEQVEGGQLRLPRHPAQVRLNRRTLDAHLRGHEWLAL